MQNELSCLPQANQGWLLLSCMYSYTNLSHMGPYDALLAPNIAGFHHEHSFRH